MGELSETMIDRVRILVPSKETGRAVAGAFLIVIALASPASAALGGDFASVDKDVRYTRGSLSIRNAGGYNVYEIGSPLGTTIREFVSPTGTVFAVTWEGPFVPEMRQVLGAYFDRYSEALHAAAGKSRGRGPLRVQQPGLVFEIGGHMGWFYGRAYVPQNVPTKATLANIH